MTGRRRLTIYALVFAVLAPIAFLLGVIVEAIETGAILAMRKYITIGLLVGALGIIGMLTVSLSGVIEGNRQLTASIDEATAAIVADVDLAEPAPAVAPTPKPVRPATDLQAAADAYESYTAAVLDGVGVNEAYAYWITPLDLTPSEWVAVEQIVQERVLADIDEWEAEFLESLNEEW